MTLSNDSSGYSILRAELLSIAVTGSEKTDVYFRLSLGWNGRLQCTVRTVGSRSNMRSFPEQPGAPGEEAELYSSRIIELKRFPSSSTNIIHRQMCKSPDVIVLVAMH